MAEPFWPCREASLQLLLMLHLPLGWAVNWISMWASLPLDSGIPMKTRGFLLQTAKWLFDPLGLHSSWVVFLN